MKRVLSITLTASLLALSLGPSAAPAAAQTMAAAVKVLAPVSATPVLPGMNLGLRNTQSFNTGVLAAPAAGVVGLHSPAVPFLVAPVVAPVAAPAAVSPLFQAAMATPEGEATPFARSLEALAAPAPEFKDMDAGASKGSAEADFNARIGADAPISLPSDSPEAEIELLVSAPEGSGRRMTQDVYPAGLQTGVAVRDIDMAMNAQLLNLGVSPDMLKIYGAKAVGAVAQINTAVLKVSSLDAGLLSSELQNLGLKVQFGRVFKLPKPMDSEASAKTVSLKEMAKVIGADKLQAELAKVLGDPAAPGKKKASFFGRMVSAVKAALFGVAENPVLPWAVLDSWSDVNHPYLKGRFVKSVANDDDGESHGTHTAGTVVGMDRWNYEGRNYNIFPNGSATEGDILFKLNMAQADGALGTTNSWGDNSGNPEGAIEKLFVKTAEAGMHHSISAGNSGYYGKNSIGGPAIVYSDHDLVINGGKVGAVKRIKAIAASDADKRTASFSSRGPGSRTTSRDPEHYKDYPQKPDESGVGVNLVAPVPKGSFNAELGGPGASMSGTSMSNPGVFGGFMLLTRGILVLAKDLLPVLPAAQLTRFAMDLARHSMTRTAEKVAGPDEVGDGFINIQAAYDYAVKLLRDHAPAGAAPRHLSMTEFGILNGIGVAASLLAGVWLHALLLGIVGMYVAPIPVMFAYVGIKRLLGDNVSWPGVRFSPGPKGP